MENNKKISLSILSDIHILARSLMANNKEFNMAIKYDRKFLVEGEGLLKKALELASLNDSKYIIIPGDLTKDGEKKSHLEVMEILKSWTYENPQRKIFLIPGNHDINNKQAFDYKNLKKTDYIEPRDFFEIYDFLYKDKVLEFYKNSNIFKSHLDFINKKFNRDFKYSYYCQGYGSYLARIDNNLENKNSLTLLFIDTSIYSCDYEQNHKDGKTNVVGALDKNVMKWAIEKIDEAKGRKDMIFVISHHALIPNFRDQRLVLGPFIIKNWNEKYIDDDPRINDRLPIEVLADMGVKFLFTGHLHENGTAKYKSVLGNEIFNIQTGSTVTYPLPIRHINVLDDIEEFNGFSVDLKTQLIKSFSYENLSGETIKIENSIAYALENQLSLKDVLFNYVHSMAKNPMISEMNIKKFLIDRINTALKINLPKKGYIGEILKFYKDKFPIHIEKLGFINIFDADGEMFIKIDSYRSHAIIKAKDLEECLEILIEQFEEKIMTTDNIIYYYDKLMKKGISMPISKDGHSLYDFSNYIYQYKALDEKTTPSYVVEFMAKLNNPNYSITDQIIDYCQDEINEIFEFLTKNIRFEIDGSKDKFFDKLVSIKGIFFNSLIKYLKRKSNNLFDLLTFISKFILKKRRVEGVDLAKYIVNYKKITNIKQNLGKKILGRANLRSYIIDLVKSINNEVIETYENEDLNERDHYFSYVEYEDE
ncbi:MULTISPECIES: metallophosphoesterase family protein [Anaerococcus]|uniref:metallophosphoesterase family protein n=1 Tax=Anaerococcus TaxID=165779 RepID=UPI00242C45EC|nr:MULTISPECIES: metallophosphoesterase [Anaerococcus]MDD7765715.1 metallophosphoesterase [Anaerococcus vaginalis]MDY6127880.1 metallophosphoesterase [Anaerococcus sp.]